MSTKSTEGKIMQIRVHEKTYKALLEAKAQVEKIKGKFRRVKVLFFFVPRLYHEII